MIAPGRNGIVRRWPLASGILLLLFLSADSILRLRAQGTPAMPVATSLGGWPVAGRPNDIADNPEDGTIAVVDAGNSAIEILRPGGTRSHFRTGFRDPRSAAFLPGGLLLVGEAGSGSVKAYDPEGRAVLALGKPQGEFIAPNDIAVDPAASRIYVVDSATDSVRVYRSTDGAFEFQFGTTGAGPGQLRFPIAVAVSPVLGEVYVADSRNRRVAVFEAGTGAFLRTFGAAGSGAEAISFPGGLHVDRDFRIYLVESLGGFVQVFGPSGEAIGRIGEHGNGAGRLRSPKAVLVDRHHRCLVASFLDGKIEVWGLDAYENPVDTVLAATATATPAHLHRHLRDFGVSFEVDGVEPDAIDLQSLRINDAVAPDPASFRAGARPTVRFAAGTVLATLEPDLRGPTTLVLSGSTRDGRRFAGEIPVVILAPGAGPGAATDGAP